jgi:hypothetical protein
MRAFNARTSFMDKASAEKSAKQALMLAESRASSTQELVTSACYKEQAKKSLRSKKNENGTYVNL